MYRCMSLLFVLLFVLVSAGSAEVRDGKLFDPGVTLDAPAKGAPKALGRLAPLVGQWDLELEIRSGQDEPLRSRGIAHLAYNATAVYALDGSAILEFDWHDADPSLPDAATTVLRLYNRSMRRWENLFLANRSNTPLHFGGVREHDRIVLHPFGAETGSNRLPRWIFFDTREHAYRWKGISSTDRGKTARLTWAIDYVRKGRDDATPNGEPTEVTTTSSDGVELFGDHFRPAAPASPTVILFHQAGGDARGEYIARRLFHEGFEVFAWDARGGGDRFASPNRTLANWHGPEEEGYCYPYPDVVAALHHAFDQGAGGPIYAVGSSYSAALVIRLAAEHGNRLAGVASFSPAPALMGECAVETWLPRVDVPVLVFRPEKELSYEPVAAQAREVLEKHGVELFTRPDSRHGASMLDPERSAGDVEPTWERLLAFFADPGSRQP